MAVSIFEVIKSSVSIVDVYQRYVNTSVEKKGKALQGECPFHIDKSRTKHLHIYDRYWKCYECGAYGDAVDMVQKMFAIDSRLDAASKINYDFKLGHNLNSFNPTKSAVNEYLQVRRKYERFLEYEKIMFHNLTEDFKAFNEYLSHFKMEDMSTENPNDDFFWEAVAYQSALDYWTDIILNGEPYTLSTYEHSKQYLLYKVLLRNGYRYDKQSYFDEWLVGDWMIPVASRVTNLNVQHLNDCLQ
jgi:hypothetical protein